LYGRTEETQEDLPLQATDSDHVALGYESGVTSNHKAVRLGKLFVEENVKPSDNS
jgi:hypothetical protein